MVRDGDASVAVDGVEGRNCAAKPGVLARTKAPKGAGANRRGRAAKAMATEVACVRGGVAAAAGASGNSEVTAYARSKGVPLGLG